MSQTSLLSKLFQPRNLSHLYHIVFIGPTLLFIGLQKTNAHKYVFYFLGLLALLIPVVFPLPKFTFNYWNIIKSVHYFAWLPLFLYVAYANKTLNPAWFPILVGLGLLAITIHGYMLVTSLYKA
jgi:hypothetical protein